ncbi:MAG: WYL domain-containing protein [Bacilli bacterium]|nr:WYL domain-containing protein [Bacilli bacterium]MDD4547298.1 WYL domain-containing protein [Bacilli bacterium]
MSKISNVLTMLELLSNNRKYSINELASILEVSNRMVRSYKQELEKAGIYIDTIRGPYGGYILSTNIILPKRGFSKYDILLLNDIHDILKNQKGFEFNKEYLELINKVNGIYKSSKKKTDIINLDEVNSNDKYNLFLKAVREKRKMWIKFLSLDKSASERIIHPCNLFKYNDEWYVSAFCELRSEIRHFSLRRIVDFKLLDESYKK